MYVRYRVRGGLLMCAATTVVPAIFGRLMTRRLVALANAVEAVTGFLGIANVFSANTDEESWIQLTPALGDYPHAAGIQRIDKQAIEMMANHFGLLSSKMARRFGGVPFFVGHPDVPGLANDYPDKKAYGWITQVEARAEGLFGRAKWSEPGKALLANAHYKFFSPFWNGQEIGKQNGKAIYRPVELVSVGLTNHPNLPVNPLANEAEGKNQQQEIDMKLLATLVALLGLANEAGEDAVIQKVTALKTTSETLATEKQNATTSLANEQSAHQSTKTSLETQLANAKTELQAHRKGRAELLVDAAISDWRVPLANKATWVADLETDFAGKSAALANIAKPVKKTAATAGAGSRRGDTAALANAQTRNAKVQGLMNEKLAKGIPHEIAWMQVRSELAEVFAEMQQPEGASS